jgi:hypothetical protein
MIEVIWHIAVVLMLMAATLMSALLLTNLLEQLHQHLSPEFAKSKNGDRFRVSILQFLALGVGFLVFSCLIKENVQKLMYGTLLTVFAANALPDLLGNFKSGWAEPSPSSRGRQALTAAFSGLVAGGMIYGLLGHLDVPKLSMTDFAAFMGVTVFLMQSGLPKAAAYLLLALFVGIVQHDLTTGAVFLIFAGMDWFMPKKEAQSADNPPAS